MNASLEHATLARATDIPSVDRLLSRTALAPLLAQYGRTQVASMLRSHLHELRTTALAGALDSAALGDDAIVAALEAGLLKVSRPRLRPVFNLTGTVLHTNLGRAALPDSAVQRRRGGVRPSRSISSSTSPRAAAAIAMGSSKSCCAS